MTRKKKIVWTLLILFISVTRFSLNWSSGAYDFNLIYISLFPVGFNKAVLYSGWVLAFYLPAGAIAYWIKRKSLSPKLEPKYEQLELVERTASDNLLPDEESVQE